MGDNNAMIDFSDIHDFEDSLISEFVNSEQFKNSFKNNKPKITSINHINYFSRKNIDVDAIRILQNTKKAFSPVFIFKDIFYRKTEKGKVKNIHPGFCLINWTVFSDEYRNNKGKVQDLAIVKDFLRVSAEYFDRMAESYEDNVALSSRKVGMILYPIILIPKDPGLVSISDASKFLGRFITNPNISSLQVVYFKKDVDPIGLIIIKSHMSVVRLAYGVKGMRVHRNMRSAIVNLIKQISEEEKV